MTGTQRTCTFCVMDNSFPEVTFDETGRCNCCRPAEQVFHAHFHRGEAGKTRIDNLVATLKEHGRGKPYDAAIGLSGGVDSAYLAHYLRTHHDLRLLAIHVDAGWNSEAAVRNIETIVRKLDIDLYTHVIEWEEMRDLQAAFLRSGVFDQDIPQDHAFFAVLLRVPKRFGVSWFLPGSNLSSECLSIPERGANKMDATHLRAIHRRFGEGRLSSFPVMGVAEYTWTTRIAKQVKFARPLNYIDYDKAVAREILDQTYGWADYGAKHSESRWTKFYQDVYLPRKYGFDKRRIHLSSLIISGQITRAEALEELARPAIDERDAARQVKFVAKKLHMERSELEALLDGPDVAHSAYPNQDRLWQGLVRLGRRLGTNETR